MKLIFLALSALCWCASGAAAAQDPPTLADASFRDAQLMASAAVSDALADGAARIAAGDPDLIRLVDADREAALARRTLETELAVMRSQSGEASARRVAGITRDLAEATAQAAGSRATLLARFPAYADLTDPSPLSISGVQSLLRPDEALVLMQPLDGAVFLWAITPQAQTWRRVEAGAAASDVEALIARLRRRGGRGAEDASRPGRRGAADDVGLAESRRLYQTLWSPVADTVGAARTVYVVADGYLAALPPALLVSDDRTGPPAYLVRRHAIVTLPGVASLRAVRASRPTARRTSLFRGFGMVGQGDAPAKGLADLPGVRRELYSIARTLGASRRSVDLQATESVVKGADLDGVALINLAAHGVAAGSQDGPGEAALVFGGGDGNDGYLTASEAALLRLSAEMVILSACDTGATGEPGPAYGGLMRAFFYAGARSLLVSNWDLDDAAAERLTTRIVREMRAGRPAAEALRQAQLALLDDPRRPEFSDPSRWAAFSLVGDGSASLLR